MISASASLSFAKVTYNCAFLSSVTVKRTLILSTSLFKLYSGWSGVISTVLISWAFVASGVGDAVTAGKAADAAVESTAVNGAGVTLGVGVASGRGVAAADAALS